MENTLTGLVRLLGRGLGRGRGLRRGRASHGLGPILIVEESEHVGAGESHGERALMRSGSDLGLPKDVA